LNTESAQRLGQALVPLVADPPLWIHRIVESVSFIDAQTIRRARSFDFTVPEGTPQLDGRTIVPLALLARRVLSELDVCDDSGRRLPLLTSTQNGDVSAALLWAIAEEGGIDDPEFLAALSRLPTREGGDLDHVLTLLNHRHAGQEVIDLARALSTGFMVYALCDTPPGHRSLIKLAYSEPLESAGARRDLSQLLGWAPLEVAFEVRAAGEAASYHFEVTAPTGGVVRAASLAVATEDQHDVPNLPANQVAQSDDAGRLVHLHLNSVPRTSAGKVLAQVVPTRAGWLANAAFAAWSTAVILVAAYVTRGRLSASPDSSVTLLLVSNGLISAVLGRPLSHDLTAVISRGPRRIALAAAVSSYTAAFVFVAGFQGATLGVALIATWMVALVSAIALTRSWVNSG